MTTNLVFNTRGTSGTFSTFHTHTQVERTKRMRCHATRHDGGVGGGTSVFFPRHGRKQDWQWRSSMTSSLTPIQT